MKINLNPLEIEILEILSQLSGDKGIETLKKINKAKKKVYQELDEVVNFFASIIIHHDIPLYLKRKHENLNQCERRIENMSQAESESEFVHIINHILSQHQDQPLVHEAAKGLQAAIEGYHAYLQYDLTRACQKLDHVSLSLDKCDAMMNAQHNTQH